MARIRAAVTRDFGKLMTIEEINLRAPFANEVEVTLEAAAAVPMPYRSAPACSRPMGKLCAICVPATGW